MSRVIRHGIRTVGFFAALAIGTQFAQPHIALAAASITVYPTAGPVGNLETVTGGGFAAGEAVTISLSGYGTVATTTASTGRASGNISATFNIPAVPPGMYTLTATGQTSLQSGQAQLQVTSGTASGLSLLKSVSINNGSYGAGGSASPGQNLTYALQYNNSGAATATNVVITDTLAAGQQLVAYSAGCAPTNNAGVVTVTCSTASVPAFPAAGSTGTFYISTQVVAGFSGTIPNTATISASNAAQSSSNTTSVSVGVTSGAGNLQKYVSVNGGGYGQSVNAAPGDTLVYDIAYTNPVGSPVAQNVTIYDTLQPGQTFLAYQYGSAYCTTFNPGTNTLVCPVGNVAPGQTVNVHITTVVNQNFSGQITNQATESSNGGPSLVSNTTVIQVSSPGTVFGTNFTLCGTVTSFTGSAITVSGITLPIAPGATGVGSPVVGTNECISFQFNSVGQVSSLVVSSNLAGVGAICGVYTSTGSLSTIKVGGVTVATSFSSNLQYYLTPGAYYCFLLTPNGVAYAVLTGTPTAATHIIQSGGYGLTARRERAL